MCNNPLKCKYMKKIIFFLTLLPLLTSCFDDDSTAWTQKAGDITITGVEGSYTSMSFVGEHLTITPTVTTDYSDSDMDYQWLLISQKTGSTDEQGKTIEPELLSSTKDLDFEVNLPPGEYQLRLYAKAKSNDYTVTKFATLMVQTDFTQGFYILKETAEGNTELDLLNSKDILSENLLQQVKGAPLKGKPLLLIPYYKMRYVDTKTDEIKTNHCLMLNTEANNYYIVRTTDLETMYDRSNIFFDEAPADEIPYALHQNAMNYTILQTNKGIYRVSGGTGQFGVATSVVPTSKYYVYDPYSYGGGAFWDPVNHSLVGKNYNQRASTLVANLTNYDCLYCGYVYLASARSQFILCDNSTGDRYLYSLKGAISGMSVTSKKQFDAGSHMAKASYYASNARTATYIYCIDGGKIYACNINAADLAEVEIRPEGIPSNENITYVANQFWFSNYQGTPFDYLIVGTQSGNTYKLYFYTTNGGAPTGAPVKTVQGTGILKKVRFMSQNVYSSDFTQRFPYTTFD